MIKLGDEVKDKVTGFKGIATSRVEYLNGCVQFCVEPKLDKDGKKVKYEYIDQGQLERIGDGINVVNEGPGGVMPNVPE